MTRHEIAIESIDWTHIALSLANAEDATARLDERLAKSPIREGWIQRTHFHEACATMWLEGELVHLEDLVLHDARMDVRTPTPDLTKAHSILRIRRRIADAPANWPMSSSGIAMLLGRTNIHSDISFGTSTSAAGQGRGANPDTDLAEAFAAIDAAMVRVDRAIARESQKLNPPLEVQNVSQTHDQPDEDDADLRKWLSYVAACQHLPPTLAAALATDAWERFAPAPQMPWLGRMFAASLLRARSKTRWHLPCLYEGAKAIDRERRQSRDPKTRLLAQLDAIAAAATTGLSQHDRWLTARNLLARKLEGRRSTSRLPELLDYVLARPIISTKMVADDLSVTQRAAQDLISTLGLREMTGRGRYRAWGIL